jgi:hypothetical protein
MARVWLKTVGLAADKRREKGYVTLMPHELDWVMNDRLLGI